MQAASTIRARAGLALALLVLAASSAFLLYRLGAEPLQDYDEATYAQVVHEALADGNFLSFTYAGVDYFKKPPLMFWAMGASERLLGETTFAMRLPFALSGIALIAIVMLLAYDVSDSAYSAALAGAILATTAPFMETAREVRMDVPVALCIMAAVYCFVRGLKDARWFLLFGIMTGLAVLAKSVIAVFAFVAALAILTVYRRFDILKEKWLWLGAGAFLLIALPWHLFETARYGLAFWRQYIGVEVVARTQENLFWTVTITNGELVRYFEQFCEPWLWVLGVAILFFIICALVLKYYGKDESKRQQRAFVWACLVTMACISAIFFSASTKAPTYFIPLYPFAALAIALSVPPLSGAWMKALAALAALALVASAAVGTYYNAYHFNPYYATTLALAVDEKNIGEDLAGLPPNTAWYVYDNENLGSIQFYSQKLHPIALSATSTLPAGSRIVIDTSAQLALASTLPQIRTRAVYAGSQATLLEVY